MQSEILKTIHTFKIYVLVTKWPFWSECNTLDTRHFFRMSCLQAVVNKWWISQEIFFPTFSHLLQSPGSWCLLSRAAGKEQCWGLAALSFFTGVGWTSKQYLSKEWGPWHNFSLAQSASLIFRPSEFLRLLQILFLFNQYVKTMKKGFKWELCISKLWQIYTVRGKEMYLLREICKVNFGLEI